MKKKIVVLINRLGSGGSERAVSMLLPVLNRFYNIELIFLEKCKPFYQIPEDIKITYLSRQRSSPLMKFCILPFLAYRLSKILKKNKVELVQSHLSRANYVSVLAKYFFGSTHRSILVVPTPVSYNKKRKWLNRVVNFFLIKHLYPKADQIICKAEGMLADLRKHAELDDDKLSVIYNPYDIDMIKKLALGSTGFVFRKDVFYISTVGRLIELKRQKDIIAAANKLINKGHRIEVVLIGSGGLRNYLMNYADNLNIKEKIHFLGSQNNPFPFIEKSNVFVLSSNQEGFPNALAEAMVLSKPVISSDCFTGPREMLNETSDYHAVIPKGTYIKAKNGCLYSVGDVEALAKAIEFMIQNTSYRESIAKKAGKRAQDFSVEKALRKWRKLMN